MPSRSTAFRLASLLLLLAGAAAAQAEAPEAASLEGIVRSQEAAPIASALVYAYHLTDLSHNKVLTDLGGRFRFEDLPAGLYKIIAFKNGFLPAVVRMQRESDDQSLFLDLHLAPEEQGDTRAGESYWEVRSSIPADVLRDIEISNLERLAHLEPGGGVNASLSRFRGGVQLGAGVDQIANVGDAQLAGGQLDFEGSVGGVDIGVSGDFWRLRPLATADPEGAGTARQLSFNLESSGDAQVSFVGANNQLMTALDGVSSPVDYQLYRLSYEQPWGESGRSTLAAEITDENNFYRRGLIDPVAVPGASRTLRFEGSYVTEIGDRSTVGGGVTYRERQAETTAGGVTEAAQSGHLPYFPASERVELFGHGAYRARPSLLVEYGVYSVLRNGELDLAPQGGLIVQLSSKWQAETRFSGRVNQASDSLFPVADFVPLRYDEAGPCQRGDELCGQLVLSRQNGDDLLSIGAIHRQIGETLRLSFGDDFFGQPESLYLVPGDRLPELQVALRRRLSPTVLTRLEGNVAAGGGGAFYTFGRQTYENDVRYFITSMDTQFQATSTGVFLGFHRLEQQLNPLADSVASVEPLEAERLELRITQKLDLLLDLPADWALQLNMELSRGYFENQSQDEDDLRRRILGGLAVKF